MNATHSHISLSFNQLRQKIRINSVCKPQLVAPFGGTEKKKNVPLRIRWGNILEGGLFSYL